jgi:GrpB-like predicted nucleotidyltransferase (UPF0157 family)
MPKLPDPSSPFTDDRIREVTVGVPAELNAPITLVDYDARWPDLFDREAQRIRVTLGRAALLIEHVGSTAVPGLVAKPIIDIDLVVADSASEPDYLSQLERAGYVLRIREPNWYEHRLFKGPDTDVNLHVFSPECDEVARHLAFRDWLRTHPEDLDLYARAKRELARRRWKYVQNYADAKSAVVIDILRRAGCR